MMIKVLSDTRGFVETEIPDDFEFLRVTLMTGDEIIEIYRRDPMWGDPYLYRTIDMECANRIRDFLDATYFVYPHQLEVWGARQKGYYIMKNDEFKKTFKGYVGRP